MSQETGRQAILNAFDRLLDKAATKLHINFTEGEKDEAKRSFVERFENALHVADLMEFPSIPDSVLHEMEQAIEDITPAEIAGYLAAGPLVNQVHQIARAIAVQAAEQRMLEHYLRQADDRYGGN